MWDDVDNVPVFQILPVELTEKAPETEDRLDMSLFFLQQASMYTVIAEAKRYRQRGKTYYYSAAITALCSTEDSFSLDAERLGLSEKWKPKEAKKLLRADPLLATLRELRNYAVHFQVPSHRLQPFEAVWGGEKVTFSDSTFFEPIDWAALSRLRNIQEGRSEVTQVMVEWFNRQASAWPAGNLLAEAGRRYAVFYGDFLRENH